MFKWDLLLALLYYKADNEFVFLEQEDSELLESSNNVRADDTTGGNVFIINNWEGDLGFQASLAAAPSGQNFSGYLVSSLTANDQRKKNLSFY